MLRHWLLLVAYCTAVLCLPFPTPTDDETDSEASRKVLGSSVVTSVSVIMDLGNGTKKYYADAAGNPVPKPTSASMLGSPPDLLHPDRYEFYTFNEAGDLVKRLMTLEEIQGIIATGDGESGELPPNYYHQELPTGLKSPTLLGEGEIGELSSPVEGVHEVVESVQNVLKEEMQAAKNKTPSGTTSRPTTVHFSTWTSGELMDTSTSVRSSTATTPTTFRPSSRKPAKRPSTHRPSSKPPTSTSRTTSLPSSTTASPQKISRKPVSPSSRLPTRKPSSTTTESPQKTTHSSTVRYSTTATSTTTPTTTNIVPEKEESSSKIPVTGDIDGNLLDNEVSYASASNINAETLNNTKNISDAFSSTEATVQTSNSKTEAVSKIPTSSGAAVADKTTEKPTEKHPEHSVESNYDYSGDSSVTSVQNVKPSVTVIANSTVNTISVQTSTGKPNLQNVANQSEGGSGNSESSHNAGETSANKNSSTTIQNVEPMVTIIINSTVNTASASTTVKDPVSAQPLMTATVVHKPGVPNLHASPSSTVTEQIAPEDASEELTTTDSSSEENSSSEEDSPENSDSMESVSTEFPDDILTTLLHILGADVTTQSSAEHDPAVDAKTNDTKANSMAASHQADADMGLETPGIIPNNTDNIVSLPSEINTVNGTENIEYLNPQPLANDSFFMEKNQSISSIVEMLMDNKSTADTIDNLIAAQNSLSSKDNFSVSLQEETKISPTTYLLPPTESVQNSVKVTATNETTENLGVASSESGTVVPYANDLLAQTDKPKIQFTPTESSLINGTTKTSNSVETTMKILAAVESTTYGLTDADSEKHTPSELSTEAQTSTTKFNKNTEKSSVNNTDKNFTNVSISHIENKITAPSEIDEVIEKQTISPDSYFVIPGNNNAVEEADLLAPPVQENLDNSAINTYATNESEIQNADASTNIKSAVVKLNQTENHTTIVPHINVEITTKLMETVDESEKLYTTLIMSTATTEKPAVINPNVSAEEVVAHSVYVPLNISPELAESVSNVLSQVSNKTATTILTTDKETTFDATTHITTTNLDDSATMPFMSSTMVNEVEKNSTVTSEVKTTKENITGMSQTASVQTVTQDNSISQGPLDTAESNTAVNRVTASAQETTTNLYAAETMSIMSMDTKAQDKNEAAVAPVLEHKNETGINEVIKEDTKEIEMETKVSVKNRGNASDENLSMIAAVDENVLKQAQSGLSTTIQAQNETLTAASSVVEEHTGLTDRHNGSLNRPQKNTEGTTMTLQETTTPKSVEPAEEMSTVLFTETSNDITTATVLLAKNKPQDTAGTTDANEQATTVLPVSMSGENLTTDKLLLASQIKSTQVKLIDGEEEHLLKVDTITAPNKENGASDAASQTVEEEISTPAWQKIFDSSENEVNKSASIKPTETTAVTESNNETNYIDITKTDSIDDTKNATEANNTSGIKLGEGTQKIESVLEGGNSIVSEERTEETSEESKANKSSSTIIAVPGITQAIFHTEVDDRLASTEEPTITTTDIAKMVAETILPSRFVESIASGEDTSTQAGTEGADSTEKTWSPVSTAMPPQTKQSTTSRTADQTTKAHADMRVTTLGDVRRPAQSPPVELGPAPEENLGLEATALGLDKDVSDFVDLCNELALRLWKPVANKRATVSRSLVVSPFAVTSLLAMVFLGARGGTSGQMNDILRLDDMVTFNPHQVFRNVTASLVMTKNPGVATAAFVRELYSDKTKGKLLDFYKERAQQFYDGHVEEVNFNMVGDVVRRRTNLLVKRQTSGRVAEYIRGSNIMLRPPLSVFSANIFQTDCGLASTTGRDGEMYFTVVPASRQRRLVPVPAAVWRSGFLAGYEPALDATVAALGAGDSAVSTLLVLPGQQSHTAPGDSVAALEDRLWNSPWSERAWSRLLRTLLPRPGLELQLPRFSHRSMLNLTATLQKMGLQDLFSEGRADLKGLNGLANDLHLSDIVQVNTFGTCGELVADARHHVEVFPSTSQRVGRRGGDEGDGDLLAGIPLALRPRQARLPDAAPRLRFDRPFLYAVRHNPTGLLLHMGRFNPRLVR